MKNVELRPIQTPKTNYLLKGPDGVEDLPIAHVQWADGSMGIVSTWYAPLWSRIKFLFDGRVNLAVCGRTHPPANISLGVPFETE